MQRPQESDRKFNYYLLLIGAVALFFLLLELNKPYFFLQDDNRDNSLPYFIHNARSILQGELPLYNFHQFLGLPALATGMSAAAYPLTYPAIAVSKLFSGGYYASIDIFVIMHALIGAAGMLAFLSAAGITMEAALPFALAWPLNSYFVYIASSWCPISAGFAFLPWCLLFALRLAKTGAARNVLWLAAARAMIGLAGYPQYFVYCSIFEALFALWLIIGTNRRMLKPYLLSHVLSALLAMPAMLPMWHEMQISADRTTQLPYWAFISGGNNLFLWAWGLVWPFSFELHKTPAFGQIAALFFGNVSWFDWFVPYFAHIGYAALFFALYAAFNRAKDETLNYNRVFWALFAVALLWSAGFLNRIIYLVPFLNRFRYPIKLNIFVSFFLIAAAALGFQAYLDKRPQKRRLAALLLAAITFANFLLLYAVSPRRNFFTHNEPLPLSEPLAAHFADSRIATLGGYPGNNGYYAELMGFDYATLFGLYHFAGYNMLLPAQNAQATGGLNERAAIKYPEKLAAALPHLRRWGVRWYITDTKSAPKFSQVLAAAKIAERFRYGRRVVYEDAKALPLVFRLTTYDKIGLSYSIGANRISVATQSGKPDYIVVNFIYNKFFRAELDGKPAPVKLTPLNQMGVFVPAGRHEIVFKYRDPYFTAGILLMLLGLATVLVIAKKPSAIL